MLAVEKFIFEIMQQYMGFIQIHNINFYNP